MSGDWEKPRRKSKKNEPGRDSSSPVGVIPAHWSMEPERPGMRRSGGGRGSKMTQHPSAKITPT